ncbi:CHASE2 domain-containing protein [Kinneretia asaccharophila]|nr:CHASE2 domain-containing protein [Roseateles asaccharophilus]MDN3545886.1 CHASE2 domain-containing protein [Roseateles asaccharophilus]
MPIAQPSPVATLWRCSADRRRFLLEWFALAVLALAAAVLLCVRGWGGSIGQLFFDAVQRIDPAEASAQVLIVAIDDASIDELGGWPIPRDSYAKLLDRLADPREKPRSVGIDVLFLDPRPEDAQLARAMREHRVYLAMEYRAGPDGVRDLSRKPSAELERAATGMAHINLAFEKDGVIRGAKLMEGTVPHLALAMYGAGSFPDSVDSYRRFRLFDPARGVPTVSLSDVLEGRTPAGLFKDRHVLVGAVAPSLGDHYPTVYSGREGAGTPGVVLHAALLTGLLRGELIELAPTWVVLLATLLAITLVLAGLVLLSPGLELLLSMFVLVSTLLLSGLVLAWGNVWIDPSAVIIVVLLIKPAWAWRRMEMIVSFMRQRAGLIMSGQEGWVPEKRSSERLDTVLQTSRLLDRAIRTVKMHMGFLRTVLDASPNPMLVVDQEHGVLMCNTQMQELLPPIGEAVPIPLATLFSHLQMDGAHSLPQLAERPVFISLVQQHGTERHFILRAASLPAERGGQWLLAMADVTEMRSLQLQRDMTLQLLTHDMRTPVASIIALCRRDVAGTGAQVEHVLGIQRHAQRLLRLMDDFIISIAAESPRYQMSEAVFDFLLDEAIDEVKDLAESRHIDLHVNASDEPAFLSCDQRLIVRVLANLLVNAIRHGQPGSVVSVSYAPVAVPPGSRYLECKVCNHVAPRSRQAGADAHQRGFGLGRQFVETVVRRHGGEVTFEVPEVVGQLASIRLRLPLGSAA